MRLIFFFTQVGSKRKGVKKKERVEYSGGDGCDVRAPVTCHRQKAALKTLPQGHKYQAAAGAQEDETDCPVDPVSSPTVCNFLLVTEIYDKLSV